MQYLLVNLFMIYNIFVTMQLAYYMPFTELWYEIISLYRLKAGFLNDFCFFLLACE